VNLLAVVGRLTNNIGILVICWSGEQQIAATPAGLIREIRDKKPPSIP
jgi:hypothetical protein